MMQLDRPDREKIYENVAKVQLETKVTKTVKLKSFLWVDYVDLIALHIGPSHFCAFAITHVPPTHASLIESNPGASQRCLYHSSPRSAGPQIPTNPIKIIKSLECTSVHQ